MVEDIGGLQTNVKGRANLLNLFQAFADRLQTSLMFRDCRPSRLTGAWGGRCWRNQHRTKERRNDANLQE